MADIMATLIMFFRYFIYFIFGYFEIRIFHI